MCKQMTGVKRAGCVRRAPDLVLPLLAANFPQPCATNDCKESIPGLHFSDAAFVSWFAAGTTLLQLPRRKPVVTVAPTAQVNRMCATAANAMGLLHDDMPRKLLGSLPKGYKQSKIHSLAIYPNKELMVAETAPLNPWLAGGQRTSVAECLTHGSAARKS